MTKTPCTHTSKKGGVGVSPALGTPGFTLVEILVSMAIFITVMGGVSLLFTSAIRLTKQGFQAQEAFEIARGTLDVIERDLSRAFASREHGDNYSFYGTPIGFTFVGLITADESSSPNLARVTYVIYHDPDARLPELSPKIIDSLGHPDVPVPTYHLLRYVESGGEDLESFPVDWSATIPDSPDTLQDIIGDPDDLIPVGYVGAAIVAGLCADTDIPCLKEIEKSSKREIWIRMLSGGDIDVPSAWDEEYLDLNPLDYVVAENIRFLRAIDTVCDEDALTQLQIDNGVELDDLWFEQTACVDSLVETQNCVYAISDEGAGPPNIGIDTDIDFNTADFDPESDRVPFFTYREFGSQFRTDPCTGRLPLIDPVNEPNGDPRSVRDRDGDLIFQTEFEPVSLQFWNDRRNIAYLEDQEFAILNDLRDNDGDGIFNNPEEALGLNLGSPLDARMPVEIGINLTLFFQSPYAGAPDFSKKFTLNVDLPTGYRRTHTAPF